MKLPEKTSESGYKDLSLKIKDEIYQLSNEFNHNEIDLYQEEAPDLKHLLFIRRISFPIAIILAIGTILLIYGLVHGLSILWFVPTLLLGCIAFSIPIIAYGETERLIKLSERYNKYISEIGDNRIIAVEDLASTVALDKEETISDLKYMIQEGYFKDARLAEDNSLLILDKHTFEIYKQKKSAILEANTEDKTPELSAVDLQREKANEVIENCSFIIQEINNNLANIKNQKFIKNVDLLISELADILNYIDKYPGFYSKLYKFETYYLPTASKLIKSYRDFEEMNLDDSLVKNSLAEINESILILIDGFRKLKLDILNYQSIDIKAEKETLNNILDLDGYGE